MSNVNEELQKIQLHCECPFEDNGERMIPLGELLKIAGYLTTTNELANVDKALHEKRKSEQLTETEQMLLEQVHIEVKEMYLSLGTEVHNKERPKATTASGVAQSEGVLDG